MVKEFKPKHYKLSALPTEPIPNAIIYVLDEALGRVRTYITTKTGEPIPLLDLNSGSSGGGISSITSSSNTITVTGSGSVRNLEIEASLLTLINSALQSNDPISSLLNDAGYITLSDVPTFAPTDYDLEDFNNLSSDPFVRQSALSGGGVESVTGDGVDNTDPDNPVISFPTPTEIGLGDVDNTNDLDKPISTATQTELNLKENLSNKVTSITGATGTYPDTPTVKNYVDTFVVPLVSTGTSISFDRLREYNQVTPATGNLTNNLTGAQKGIIQKIYHNNAIAPTVPGGWVLIGGTYTTSQLNIIYAEWISGSRVEYWIAKG